MSHGLEAVIHSYKKEKKEKGKKKPLQNLPLPRQTTLGMLVIPMTIDYDFTPLS